jgi:gamma-glutamylcyclotransferase (GGCT)/AIG2-like uncharacterized protein YtfP
MSPAELLYFAYGSNMASRVMTARIATARRVGIAELVGYRISFHLPSQRWGHRAAGIEPDPAGSVWGVLWEIDDASWDVLDEYERAYVRTMVEVTEHTTDGTVVRPVATYLVREDRAAPDDEPPAPEYLAAMLAGARETGLPGAYVDRLRSLGGASA